MVKESFESLNEYKSSNDKYFVNESLLLEADDDGVLGKIVDRGLTFVPRAMRFKKAKKIMKKYLEAYTKKSKNLVSKFTKSLNKKVNNIESEYKKFKNEKLQPLLEEGKKEEALKLAKSQLTELEEYKKEQIQQLNKGIEGILNSYTKSVEHRIDNPGFVLNVELSEKGKGELKAKWAELVAIQNTKIDEYRSAIIKSEGWKTLDSIISELTGLVEERGHGGEIDTIFNVHDIVPQEGDGEYLVRVHLRLAGGRPEVLEKGVLVGDDPEELSINQAGVRKIKEVGTYQYNARPYKLLVKGDPSEYVLPYIVIKLRKSDKNEVIYAEAPASLDVRRKSKEEKMRGDVTAVTGKQKEDDDQPDLNDPNK